MFKQNDHQHQPMQKRSEVDHRSQNSHSEMHPYLVVTSELNAFASQLVGPNVQWFNEKRERAEELANMLLPDRCGTSLRLSDHLVVQYSREHHIAVTGDHHDVPTELWLDYRRILASTGKKYFDVFKRKNAIRAKLLGVEINTTVGQLTFLCWYQKRGLHNYMKEHEAEVREHMQRNERSSSATSDKVNDMEKSDRSDSAMTIPTREKPVFKRVSTRNHNNVRTKKRKSRAPSRSDSVKPQTRLFTGTVEMTYT